MIISVKADFKILEVIGSLSQFCFFFNVDVVQ